VNAGTKLDRKKFITSTVNADIWHPDYIPILHDVALLFCAILSLYDWKNLRQLSQVMTPLLRLAKVIPLSHILQ
jgi:hypothetical protein